jgi:hypothetical protein
MASPSFIELNDFMFRDKFVDLTDDQLMSALQVINAQFSGVYSLWSFLPPDDACAKRKLCVNYLVAWKLVQLYPEQAKGVAGTGGMPIGSKKAGPIFIKYKNMVRQEDSVLATLTTNQFGIEALTMIQSAPEQYMVYA